MTAPENRGRSRAEKRNKKETSLIFKKKFIEFSVKIVYNRYH